LLLKKSMDVGVRYRRGITIDSEALTGDAVTNMADANCTLTENEIDDTDNSINGHIECSSLSWYGSVLRQGVLH
uniref:Polyprotein n=1 Tax=Anisakis simplex TaxID=6269 RepID=A0A0M3KKK7_ANISI